MNITQLLTIILYFAVFILLFVALVIYIGKAVWDYVKGSRTKKEGE